MVEINQEKIKEYVNYCEITGKFYLIKKLDKKRMVGDELGYPDGRGYIHLSLFGKKYKAHRVAWLYMTGKWPTNYIDHIDGNCSNNKFSNLRECNNSQNQANTRKIKSMSGYKGVYPVRNKNGDITGWCSQHNKTHLGVFPTKELAAEAYDKQILKIHGAFAATNKELIYGK